jgi:type IV secretory pathway VirB10-like protein
MNKVSTTFKALTIAGLGGMMTLLLVFGTWGEQEVVRNELPEVDRSATDEILTDSIGLSSGENVGQVVALTNDQEAITTGFVDAQSEPVEAGSLQLTPEETLRQKMELKRLEQILEAQLAEELNTEKLRSEAMSSKIGPSQIGFTQGTGSTGREAVETGTASGQAALPALSPSLVLARPTEQPQTGEAVVRGESSAFGPAQDPVGYSKYTRSGARSPYEVKKGTVIPGTLVTEINSDIPGNVVGMVRLDVYDTVTGSHLLIPAGSRLFGIYDPNVDYAQKRINVVWTHLIFPDGDTLVLENQQAMDVAGRAGFADKRKGNFLANLGGNLLYSIFGAGETAVQTKIEDSITGGSRTDDSSIGSAIAGLGSQLGRGNTTAASVFNDKQSRLQPTLKIRSGYRFNIMVSKDIILEPS